MSLRSLLAHQLGRPSGLVGRFMGRTLNRVNGYANRVALELLALRPTDHLLDVGFGGGVMLREAAKRLPGGFAAGIEISLPMLKRARRLLREEIRHGRLEIREGNVAAIPYADERFDKACTINTLHFWPDPPAGLRELLRILKPGGVLIVVVRPKDFLERIAFTKHGFAAFDEPELRALLEGSGFRDVMVERRDDRDMGIVVAAASKSVPAGSAR
jgi:ubiquinone/menaquinone biosynthesis C-methylase UbiE